MESGWLDGRAVGVVVERAAGDAGDRDLERVAAGVAGARERLPQLDRAGLADVGDRAEHRLARGDRDAGEARAGARGDDACVVAAGDRARVVVRITAVERA